MRFIAVFNQPQATYGLGFESLLDAVDFLFWGYEDQELQPQGVYDSLTDQATPYEHAGRLVSKESPGSIRAIARKYLETIQPLASVMRVSAG
ncbi:hypothetical protein [Spirosoma linguale]|uniref:Uncharacterized protein n=1 Tax=Spirosoma linguale (strain ATCC 33905 / DSM 74 / LMG 10896 / Claus 1) TaxID=504472 RepID=D2QIV4_SPILD|nr:hypothetical protein Slin_4040 [Spirosoma linguale DSM 74]